MPGPLSFDELKDLWRDVTDKAYWQPMESAPNGGIEAIDQAATQAATTSVAVDKSTQAIFIFPWSGQTSEPSSGARKATVQLTAVRTTPNIHLVLERGLVYLHVTTDFGENGAQEVTTGRRYFGTQRSVFLPGDSGPVVVSAEAEMPGTGYNLPQPGTIRRILAVGTELSNDGATVLEGNRLQLSPGAGDALAPAHVLSYIQITDGPNAGQYRRVLGYLPGSPPVLLLDSDWRLRGVLTGAWTVSETVTQASSGAIGRVIAGNGTHLLLENVRGTFVVGSAIVGDSSGASFVPVEIELSGVMAQGSTSWRIVDWATEFGLSVTNVDFPSGGRLPMLDEIGDERNVRRTIGEGDDTYRDRVGNPADLVAPNAIRRTVNHILAPYNVGCCFRQVGGKLLPGVFYDVPKTKTAAVAYDRPITATNRFQRIFDLLHFRGWFLLGVPPMVLGEFGMAYDAPVRNNAYDARIRRGNYFDGYPVGTRKLHAAIRAAVDRARAGGVQWDLYIERIGCV